MVHVPPCLHLLIWPMVFHHFPADPMLSNLSSHHCRLPISSSNSSPAISSTSPFYSKASYIVLHTLPSSTHLQNIAPVNCSIHRTGTVTRITDSSEYNCILLRLPINSILDFSNVVLLHSIITVLSSSPIITNFSFHPRTTARLRIVVLLDYHDNQLHFFSEPDTAGAGPISEIISGTLTSAISYRFRITFLREDPSPADWIIRHIQLMFLTPPVTIQIDCIIDKLRCNNNGV